MKIYQVSSHTNFTSSPALALREQTAKEPAYKKVYAQKAASYSGLSLGYETSLHSKQAYNQAQEMLEGAKKIQNDVQDLISKGEANLFENFSNGKKSITFSFDKDSKQMHMKEIMPLEYTLKDCTFNENGIKKITVYGGFYDMAIHFEKNMITKIEEDIQEQSDGSNTSERLIIYRNEKPSKIFFNYREDKYGTQSADSVYEYDLYSGRWDWGRNYKKGEENLEDDDYIKYDERFGFETGCGLVAQAKGYNDQIIKKTAQQLILFEQGRVLSKQADCNLDKKDWTNCTIAIA